MKTSTKQGQSRTPIALRLALSFFICSFGSAIFLQTIGVFERNEAQNINRFFEIRRWIKWAPSSLAKLNPQLIWQYHQQHEFPRHLWNWDYTLSWLIADNHPPITQKIVIFNHLNEDDAPAAAATKHPWLKPLLDRTLSRSVYVDWISLLTKSGAKAIILDNEFPQYTANDAKLAQTIVDADAGKLAGSSIPVLFARTVNCRTQGNLVGQLVASSNGLLDELERIRHDLSSDAIADRYTGSVGVLEGEDQIVRRLATRIDGQFQTIESIPLKVLDRLGSVNEKEKKEIPDHLYIDFSGGANSEHYPIRPLTYLLNPQLRNHLGSSQKNADDTDINVKDAIVIIGDGITDVFNTSTTNLGVDVMSGPEVLANGIDTISRRSWLKKLNAFDCIAYIFAATFLGSLIVYTNKTLAYRQLKVSKKPLVFWFADLTTVILLVSFTVLIPAFAFAYTSTILPVICLFAAFLLASIVITLLERDHLREQSFIEQINNEREKLTLVENHHEQELATEAAKAKVREIEIDQNRRAEFVKRLRHDILGPASSINWTLLRLQKEEVTERVRDRFQVLMRNSDTLINLVDELTRVYTSPNHVDDKILDSPLDTAIDINSLVEECVKSQKTLAEEKGGDIEFIGMPESVLGALDSTKLTRIISNLIRNAFLHNPPKTDVVIELKKDDDCLKISVRDNGKGIAPERIEEIFSDGVTSAGENSNHQGLGLGIVKTLTTELGGKLTVESKVNEGTTFQISFPNRSQTPQSSEKKSA